MPASLKERMHDDFLFFLNQTLSSKETIDIAIRDRKSVFLDNKSNPVSLSTIEAYEIFDDNGEANPTKCEQLGITFDSSRINMKAYDLESMSLRERLILDAAISTAHNKLIMLYKSNIDEIVAQDEEAALTEFKEIYQQTPKEVIKELKNRMYDHGNTKLMTTAKSTELRPSLRQALNNGFHQFTSTNIFISAGPSGDDNREMKLSEFFKNLEKQNIKHVFAIGLPYPYHPQDGIDESRIIETGLIVNEDFYNYFIPDVNGKIKLPNLAAFAGYKVESVLIEKIGRISTYEIRINGKPPIQIHHYPLRDKQPLELTEGELDYVLKIQKSVPSDQNILTHCHGGKGRSAQLAYILASNTKKYSGKDQLKKMRMDRMGDPNSRFFVETELQENYLSKLDEKLHGRRRTDFEKSDKQFLARYRVMELLFREEMERISKQYGIEDLFGGRSLLYMSSLSTIKQDYVKFIGLYQELQQATNNQQIFTILHSAQTLSCVSMDFKKARTHAQNDFLLDQLVATLKNGLDNASNPVNRKILFDTIANNFIYSTADAYIFNAFHKYPIGVRTKSEYIISYKMTRILLSQAYLRQYKNFDYDKQISCSGLIASQIKSEIANLANDLIRIKKDFDTTKNTSALVQWKKSYDLLLQLKDAETLYRNNVALLASNDGQHLTKKIAELEQIFSQGIDKVRIADEGIMINPQQPVTTVIAEREIPKARSAKENMVKVNELWIGVEHAIKRELANEKDINQLLDKARNAFILHINDDKYRDNLIIASNIDKLDQLSETLRSLHQDASITTKTLARKAIFTQVAKVFSAIQESYDPREPYAKDAKKAAEDFAKGREAIRVQIRENQDVSELIKQETALAKAKVASVKRQETEALKSREDLITESLKMREVKSDDATVALPACPKIIIFDVDDTLIDLAHEKVKNKEILFNLLRKVKQLNPPAVVAICTNRTTAIDQDRTSNGNYTVNRLIKEIKDETGLEILPEFQVLYTDDIKIKHLDKCMAYEQANSKGELDKKQAISRLIVGKNTQLDEIRKRYQQYQSQQQNIHVSLPKESECLFIDDAEAIYKQTIETTNYRAVKATDRKDESESYIVEIGYQLGFYNPLIKFLSDTNHIVNTDGIPNFKELGFKDTSIVRHVSLEQFYKSIGKLPGRDNKSKTDEYKYDFTLAAIEKFSTLPTPLQDNAAKFAFDYIASGLQKLQTEMIQLLETKPNNLKQKQADLLKQLHKLMALEKQYQQHVGLSYLYSDLYTMQAILRTEADAITIITADNLKTLSVAASIEIAKLAISMQNRSGTTSHTALEDYQPFIDQREKYKIHLNSQLRNNIDTLVKEYKKLILLHEWSNFNETEALSYSSLVKIIADDTEQFKALDEINPPKATDAMSLYNSISKLQLILIDIKNLAPAARLADKLNGDPEIDYVENIDRILARTKEELSSIQAHPQYQAMIFLDKMEKYIHSPDRNWNVGPQWRKHTLGDTNKRIPKHVAMQLAEIEAAKIDGNYIQHMNQLISIGKRQANSFFCAFSSKSSRMHSKLFKNLPQEEVTKRASIEERIELKRK